MEYQLVRLSLRDYEVRKNESLLSSLKFPANFPVSYGYQAETSTGELYELRSTGLFFWKKIRLFKDGVKFGEYSSCATRISGRLLYRDRSNSIFYDGVLVANARNRNLNSGHSGIVSQWRCENPDLEWAVITLLVMSLQGKAASPVSAIP
ncbi:hypothetical protein FHR99_002891 [Litorivivens lipolytica]|uniref:Uncharacterized protein n=1 Tax=Litorivivens lipolytica TaxID=1524264 RepID=A0A7W4Z6V3_9GAMM|nr:hypothetical protein [Litorivivens lipolytica]MBB3048617.1 hypothetical protein [Litorivivens lipolytica]